MAPALAVGGGSGGRAGDGGGVPTTALPRPAPAPPRSPLPTRLLTFLLGTGIIVQRSRATDMLILDDGALAAVTAGRCGAMAVGVRATAIGMRRRASCAALEMMGAMVSLRSDYTQRRWRWCTSSSCEQIPEQLPPKTHGFEIECSRSLDRLDENDRSLRFLQHDFEK